MSYWMIVIIMIMIINELGESARRSVSRVQHGTGNIRELFAIDPAFPEIIIHSCRDDRRRGNLGWPELNVQSRGHLKMLTSDKKEKGIERG